MIVFTKIRWKNILSTGNIFTEVVFNKNKNTLIVGDNGSGKSTILDALTFALFGKAFRNINKPQLVNTINNKDMVVELYFNIGSNSYKIIRGIKPSVFEVYMNNKLLNQTAESKDYQEILEKQILKVNYKSFCQVVILGSATFQPFMQLSKGQRREIIEDLLDLQIFTSMNALLKNKISNNSNLILECTNNQKLLEQKIAIINEHVKKLHTDKTQLISERNDSIQKIETEILTANNELLSIKKNIDTLLTQTKTEDKIKKKIKELESLKHKIEANLSILEKDIIFFDNNDKCPTCSQDIDLLFKENITVDKKKNITEIKDGLVKLNEEYKKILTKLENINKINIQINEYKIEYNNLKNKIGYLENTKNSHLKEIQSLEKNDTKSITLQTDDIEEELLKSKELYNNLIEQKNLYSAASVLLKDNGIKSKIIKQYVPIINKLINKYLSALDFYVQFELNEEFEEIIKSRHRDVFTYSSFSEGEKMKINLAILFTWRAVAKLRNSINTNLLIMDEIFDSSLDLNATDEFIKLLNTITDDTNTFIISHKKDQLLDKFDNILLFEKKKNFSKIIKGI